MKPISCKTWLDVSWLALHNASSHPAVRMCHVISFLCSLGVKPWGGFMLCVCPEHLNIKKVCEVMVEVFYSITSSTQILKASPQNKQNTSPWNHNRSMIWQVMKYACNSGNFFFKGLNPLNQIKQLQQQYWWLHNGILGQRHAVVNRLVPLKWRVLWSCETKWIGSCFQEKCQKHSLVLAS